MLLVTNAVPPKTADDVMRELLSARTVEQGMEVLVKCTWEGQFEQVLEVLRRGSPMTSEAPCFKILQASLLAKLDFTKEATDVTELLQKSRIVAAKILCAMVPLIWRERSTAVDMLFKILSGLEESNGNQQLQDIFESPLTTESVAHWRRRVKGLLISCYTTTNDYMIALDLCDKFLQSASPQERIPILLQMARIRLQIGDVEAAKVLVHELKRHPNKSVEEDLATELVEGLVQYASSNFIAAEEVFGALLRRVSVQNFERALRDPSELLFDTINGTFDSQIFLSATLSNNLALCQLNLSNLAGSIDTLEGCILSDPYRNLCRAVIFNLCTLYDLAKPKEQSQLAKDALRQLADNLGILNRFTLNSDFRL